MAFDNWVTWVVLLHVVAAVSWAGGAMFLVAVIGPTLQKAGPKAGGFLAALAERGGFSRFFLGVGAVTIVLGGILYWKENIASDPWNAATGALYLTLGAIIAVIAYLDGLFLIMPEDRKLGKLLKGMQGPPTPEQAAELQRLGKKIGMMSAVSTLLVVAVLVLMVARRLV